jgi:hypothetical protein
VAKQTATAGKPGQADIDRREAEVRELDPNLLRSSDLVPGDLPGEHLDVRAPYREQRQ